MKKAKFITAIGSIVMVGSALPLAIITGCGPKGEQITYTEAEAITPKEQEGNNSFKVYTAKLADMPKDGKAKVRIVNSSASQDQMGLVSFGNNGLTASSEIEVDVPQSKEVAVSVIMKEPPVDSSESSFELEYVYTDSTDKTKGEKLSNCKYSYDISNDYVDLSSKDTPYIPSITPKTAWTSRDAFVNEYIEAILTGTPHNEEILAQDLYYTVSKHVIEAKSKTEGQAGYLDPNAEVGLYLNDIAMYPDGGIWLRINFKIKADKFIPFLGNTFTNIDATFQLTLDTGYTVTLEDSCDANKAWKLSVGLKTPSQQTTSHGRFKGEFEYNGGDLINYDGTVSYNDSTWQPTKPVQFASNFATGGMAWIFNATNPSGNGMNFYTYYGKNVQNVAPMGTVTIDGTDYVFNNLEDSHICSSDGTQKIVLFEKNDTSKTKEITRTDFDGKIVFGNRLKTIPSYFLAGCSNFDSDIDFSAGTKVTQIGEGFMSACSSFNKKIDFSAFTNLEIIGPAFMFGCLKWNNGVAETSNASDEFIIPSSVTKIGDNFMDRCGYAQNITVPSNLMRIGSNFMSNMENMNGKTITINCGSAAFVGGLNDYSFACYFSTEPSDYKIFIKGDIYFETLHNRFPDLTWTEGGSYVRKLAQIKSVTLTPDEFYFADLELENYDPIEITNDPSDPTKAEASWNLKEGLEIPADQKWEFKVPTSSSGEISKEVIVKKGATSFNVKFTDDEWAQINDQASITIQPEYIYKTCPVIAQSDIEQYFDVVEIEPAVQEWDTPTQIWITIYPKEGVEFVSGTAYIVAKSDTTKKLSSSDIDDEPSKELGLTFNLDISAKQWHNIPYGDEIELHYQPK